MTDKCPACGGESVGIAEVFGAGALRFAPICADCRWTTEGRWTSIQEAFDSNRDVFKKWDSGERMEGKVTRFDDTLAMVSGAKRSTSVGELRLEGIAEATGAGVKRDLFRDATEQARFDTGQPVVKTYICDGCRAQQGGAEIKGDFYAMPAGWYLQHPSARLYCSSACVEKSRGD